MNNFSTNASVGYLNRLKIRSNKIRLSLFGLIIIFITLPLMKYRIFGIGIQYYSSIFALVTIALTSLFEKKLYLNKNLKYFVLFYLFLLFLSLFSEVNNKENLIIFPILRFFVLTSLILSTPLNNLEFKLINIVIVIFSFIVALIAIINPYKGIDNRVWINFFGELQDPNYFTLYFIMPTAIIYEYIIKSKNKILKILGLMLLMFLVLFIISTGSRGGVLAVLTTLFLQTKFFSSSFSKKISNFIFIFLLFLILYLLITMYLPSNLLSRYTLNNMLSTGGAGRINIWLDYISLIFKLDFFQSFVGYGLGESFNYIFVPHNQFLTLVFETGIFGIVIFVLFYTRLIFSFSKEVRNQVLPIFIGYLVQISFVTVTFDRYFWVCLTFLCMWATYKSNLSNK